MGNRRHKYSLAQEVALAAEVDGYCPLCGIALFYNKQSRTHKGYQLAHIYPLNPTPDEELELEGSVDSDFEVNHPHNIIALCPSCHSRFDKPRTRQEYDHLAQHKRKCLEKVKQREIFSDYPLESEIDSIINQLSQVEIQVDSSSELAFDAKKLDEKFDKSLPSLTRNKIRYNVAGYYQYVQRAFQELERQSPDVSSLIFAEVKSFYLKQKTLGESQSQVDVFYNIVKWLSEKSSSTTPDAPEIVASFFVQNCEVFE